MEVVDPCLHCVETDSFCDHVLAALTSDVERSFVSDFTAANSLAFNYFERFFMFEITFADLGFAWVEVFGTIVTVGSGSGERTHLIMTLCYVYG